MKHYSADDAAAKLGVSSSRVRKLAARYNIGSKVGANWIFTARQLAALQARSTGKAGRPAKEVV